MDLLDKKTTDELHRSLLGEIAKSRNEIACARADLEKANSRISFLIVIMNELLNRKKD